MTGLANRKYFEEALTTAIRRAAKASNPLSLLMIDIDHFKSFNDRYGHTTGDQVLKVVAHTAKQKTRGADLVARMGGEEFSVLLPNTASDHALSVADQIRRAVMESALKKKSTGERLGRITVSVGVAELRISDTEENLVDRADRHLYVAKQSGRNRVCGEGKAVVGLIGNPSAWAAALWVSPIRRRPSAAGSNATAAGR